MFWPNSQPEPLAFWLLIKKRVLENFIGVFNFIIFYWRIVCLFLDFILECITDIHDIFTRYFLVCWYEMIYFIRINFLKFKKFFNLVRHVFANDINLWSSQMEEKLKPIKERLLPLGCIRLSGEFIFNFGKNIYFRRNLFLQMKQKLFLRECSFTNISFFKCKSKIFFLWKFLTIKYFRRNA